MIVEYEFLPYVDICNLYRTLPDPRDLATYIKGPGGDDVGQIESKPG
jgi:hypothetical protein